MPCGGMSFKRAMAIASKAKKYKHKSLLAKRAIAMSIVRKVKGR